jgi:hypothetical protein
LNGSLLGVEFNETVILNEDWTKEHWVMNISGPMEPYDIEWDFLSETILKVPYENISIWFQFEMLNDLQLFGNGSEVLTIYFNDMEVLNSYSYNFGMINETVSYNLFPRESGEDCGIGSYTLAVQTCAFVMITVGIVGLLVRHSMVIGWQIIGLLQFLNFIPLMMIYTPSCLVTMLGSFNIFNTQIGAIGATFLQSFFNFNSFNNVVDYKFMRAGYTTSAFVWTAADILTLWIICLILIPVLWMIKFIFSTVEILHKIEDRFKKSFVYVLIMMSYLRTSF